MFIKKQVYFSILLILAVSLSGCSNFSFSPFRGVSGSTSGVSKDFQKYWYNGDAEINVYEVRQARYDDIHPGKTVLIFVTEDFLIEEQVKNERYAGGEYASVLKTNLLRDFTTGLYDYSLMTSVFTPVDRNTYSHTLKVSGAAQDWCGHTYDQMNLMNDAYRIRSFSYFEKEGDQEYQIKPHLLEDEIMAIIRMDPEQLPLGEIDVIPGMAVSRLMHIRIEPVKATATLSAYQGPAFKGEVLRAYQVRFHELDRSLEVIFKGVFPYDILGWEDTYPALSGKTLTTISKRTHISKSRYWDMHALRDSTHRSRLGL